MNKYTYICLMVLASLSISSCYDSMDNSIVLESEPDTPTLITTAITGSLVDADDNKMSNYQLYAGAHIENVAHQRFLIQLEDVNKKGQAIYVKDGDVINSMLHTPLIENDINLVKLQIFNSMNNSLISSSGPDRIDISPTVTLQISTEEIRDAQGNIPTQDIYIDHRDLSHLNNISQLGISAYTQSDKLRSTNHISAFQLEIKGADNSRQTIGGEALLEVNISQTSLTTSLFHFDTENERWNEVSELIEGDNIIAIKNTGLYTISEHTKGVYAEGNVNKSGIGISYQNIRIDQRQLYSSANGKWITTIPTDEAIDMKLLTPCQTEISSYTIPPTSINIIDVDIEATQGDFFNLNTKIYDCNGELEETTAIYLQDESAVSNVYTFLEKNIETWVSVCNPQFDISTYDIDTDVQGAPIPWTTNIVDDQSFLVSCEDYQDGYSYIKIGNDKRVLPPFEANKVLGSTTLHSQTQDSIRFKFEGQMIDTYAPDEVNVYLKSENFGDSGYFISCETSMTGCGFTTWNVTHYETGNEKWVRVSFAGKIWMQTINPPEAGNFDVEGVILTKAD